MAIKDAAKHAQINYDQVNEKGLKDLTSAINATGANVLEVESNNRPTTKDGVKVKTAKLALEDGQIVTIQVNDTGDLSAIKLNGKPVPNAQSSTIGAVGQTIGRAAQSNSAKFTASLAAKAKRVLDPVDNKPAVKSNFQRLKEAKERNQQLTDNYKAAQESSAKAQTSMVSLASSKDAANARLVNAKTQNEALKLSLKQLQVGS